MNYVYNNQLDTLFIPSLFSFLWLCSPARAMASFLRGFVITHNDAPQSEGLLWTSDQFVAETSA
jgi:hypothetical protein